MDNGEKKISSLFDGRTVFNIPEYQRAYAWTKPQLKDFIEDLNNQKIDRSYFLGTVLFEEKGQDKNYEIIDIVDGQQRITTIIIFMATLLQLLKKKSDNDDDLEDLELLEETYVKHKRQYKLRALEEDNDFFHSYILQNVDGRDYIKTPAQRRLYDAKKYFHKKLKGLSRKKLNEYKDKVDSNSRVLVYSVADTAEATLIFETTNDRGKGLTNLEKIKSFMMYKSYVASEETPEELLKTIRSRFSDIYKEHESIQSKIDENSVLQYHFISHDSWTGKEYQKYVTNVKNKVNSLISKNRNIEALEYINTYTKELKESFYIFKSILSSSDENLRNIYILGRLGNFYPLLLKSYKLDKSESKEKFSEIAKLLEIYAYRIYAVNRSRGNTGQSKLYALARDFTGNFNDLSDSLRKHIKSYSNDNKFISNLSDEYIYDEMAQNDLSYFFWNYENYLRKNFQPKASSMSEKEFLSKNSKMKLSIEHIASQNPSKNVLTDNSIIEEIDEEFEEEYLHSIGNLTIDPLSANSSKSNNDFVIKNSKYFVKAPFKVQNELEEFLSNDKWGKFSIEARKEKLLNFARVRWKI